MMRTDDGGRGSGLGRAQGRGGKAADLCGSRACCPRDQWRIRGCHSPPHPPPPSRSSLFPSPARPQMGSWSLTRPWARGEAGGEGGGRGRELRGEGQWRGRPPSLAAAAQRLSLCATGRPCVTAWPCVPLPPGRSRTWLLSPWQVSLRRARAGAQHRTQCPWKDEQDQKLSCLPNQPPDRPQPPPQPPNRLPNPQAAPA
jgi:hypothetical protein